MSGELHTLLERLWEDYQGVNPDARKIHDLLEGRGERVVNDHIAFRTFNHPKVNLERLAAPFVTRGYRFGERYEFPQKRLDACHYEPPAADLPKVFVSQLRTAEFSSELQQLVQSLVDQVPEERPSQWDFPVAGRPWEVSYAAYQRLAEESEYAAWVAAFGFRANHFTIFVNALETIPDLARFNALLKENGFALNTSGGEIKGSPDVYLEQSSTLAREVSVTFTDGTYSVPGCYYEFARRYPLPDGTRFQGFVARSADRIFESTDRQKHQ